MFDPAHREDYVDYLEGEGQWEQAARQLGICVNDDDFVSPHVSFFFVCVTRENLM